MVTLNQTQLNALQDELTANDIIGFYTLLESYGDPYGRLGLAVTQNNTWQGEIANGFAESAAKDNTVDLSYQSTAWFNLNKQLAENHLDAYIANSGNEPTWDQIQDYHNDAYSVAGLNENDWFVNKLLNDSSDPAALWADYMQNSDLTDLMDDVWDVAQAGAKLLYGPLYAREAFLQSNPTEFAEKTQFAQNFLYASLHMTDQGRSDLINEAQNLVLIEFNEFLDNISDGLKDLLKDYGWAASHVIESSVETLAGWYTDLQAFFGVEVTGWWDPLVVNLDGDAVTADLTSGESVYFDIDNDDIGEAISWVTDDDGFIVRDLNSNGRIDNIGEMFGNDQINGFAALAALDADSNGVVESTELAGLQIWQDLNQDGISQSDEFSDLSTHDIISINVTDVTATGQTGGVTHTGTGATSTGTIGFYNLNFQVRQDNSAYAGDYDFDLRAAFLPTLRGYNDLPAFHIALSLDNDETDPDSLMSLMTTVAGYSMTEVFENWDSVIATLEQAMYRWAGVDGVSPSSRGQFVEDARQLEFIEAYFGSDFVDQNEWGSNPGQVQAQGIKDLWYDDLFAGIVANMLVQTDVGRLLDSPTYNFAGDSLSSSGVVLASIDELEAAATALATTAERHDFWIGVAAFFSYHRASGLSGTEGYDYITGSTLTYLDAAIQNSDSSLSWDSITYDYENPEGETIIGTSGNDSGSQYQGTADADTIVGLAGADFLQGGNGNDTLYGHSEDGSGDDGAADTLSGEGGDDVLIGGDGDDVLNGGDGNDHLIGGNGDDTLRSGAEGQQNLLEGGAGNDYYTINSTSTGTNIRYVNDSSGTDTVYIDNAQPFANLTLSRVGNTGLKLHYASGNTVTAILANQLQDPTYAQAIEYLEFHPSGGGTVTFDLIDYLENFTGSLTTNGGDNNDTIDGLTIGSGDDLIYGGAGNDIISGDDGDDFIYGENGDDILYGGDGNDRLEGGNHNDILDGGGGDDILYGGGGDDIFYAGIGNDNVAGSSGYDAVILPVGITLENLTFTREFSDNTAGTFARINVNAQDIVTLQASLGTLVTALTTTAVEEVRLADGTVINPSEMYFTTNGTSGNDTIYGITEGGSENEIINGLGGNDYIYADDGDDILDGGDGNDEIYGGYGDDIYIYGTGLDTFKNATGVDIVQFEAGISVYDLTIQNSGTKDTSIILNSGTDEILLKDNRSSSVPLHFDSLQFANGLKLAIGGSVYNSWQWGTASADNIDGDSGNNTILANAGNDVLNGLAGNDEMDGGDGDDIINGGAGDDYIFGGEGVDTADYSSASAGIIVDLENGTASDGDGGTDTLVNIEGVIGSVYNDGITGNNGENLLSGGAGNDVIDGEEGNDTLIGGAGNDALDGGNGVDTADYSGAASLVNVSLLTGTASNDGQGGADTLQNIENIIGSGYNDTLSGDDNDNTIYGGAGNDYIVIYEGTNYIYGEDGNDNLLAQNTTTGTNYLYGGAGNDTFNLGALGTNVIDGGIGTNNSLNYIGYSSNSPSAGIYADFTTGEVDKDGDTIADDSFINIHTVHGSHYDDLLIGNSANNTFQGNDGDDEIHGGGGNDKLHGDNGNDVLYGGDGNDTLVGGSGNDTFYGQGGSDSINTQAGADTVVLESSTAFSFFDKITDFDTGSGDKIDISDLLTGYNPITDLISDFARITDVGVNAFLEVDADGGANNFIQVIQFNNDAGLIADAATLEAGGNLITV